MSTVRPLDPTESNAFARLWQAYGLWPKSARERKQAHLSSLSDADLLALRIEESRGDVDPVTRQLLLLAVPLWIDRFRFWSGAARERLAQRLVETIAYSQGIAAICEPDARGTEERGAMREGFNAIAQGLALLAFCPGGVVFAGEHWQAEPGVLPAEEPA